jgi:hypothetical protein
MHKYQAAMEQLSTQLCCMQDEGSCTEEGTSTEDGSAADYDVDEEHGRVGKVRCL